MKKNMVLVVGIVSVAMIAGCSKKESAEAPIQQPMVAEQPVEGAAMTAMAPVEPAAAAQVAAVTEAATAAMEQVAANAVTIEKPTPQQIQQALKNAGLYAGKVDGSLGPKTKKAIEEFQAQNGLTADGKVGPKTWAKLGSHLSAASAIATEPILPVDDSATGVEASN